MKVTMDINDYIDRLVSIIMPVHNSENTIAEAIDSVLAQTYQNWELLIVDDCSTDNSIAVINNYLKKDSRIKLFCTDMSFGKPFYPRNIALKNARGRFIAFLDSDDVWVPSKLEKQLMLFLYDVSVVYSFYEKISTDGKRVGRVVKSPLETNYKKLFLSDVIGNLTGIYDAVLVGKVYQKNVDQEDYVMWLDILQKGYRAKCYPEVLALYRVCKHSLSAAKFRNFKWQWNTYRKVFHLNIFYSIYCYINYVIRGFIKYLI